MADIILSAFGDEVGEDLEEQLDVLANCGLEWIEVRGAWHKSVLDWSDHELHRAQERIAARGLRVSAVASPIGKSELNLPPEFELGRLERAIQIADVLETRLIRIFSFYVLPENMEQARAEVMERMRLLTERAVQANMILLHENEKEIYSDTPERCLEILTHVNSPHLRMAFDPANFVQVGVLPMTQAYPLLADSIAHVHIKDARLQDKSVVLAGHGDGQVRALLEALRARDYRGFLTLEPHLIESGPMRGRSGAVGMKQASHALERLIQQIPAAHSHV